MKVQILDSSLEDKYTSYIKRFPETLLYASVPYRNLVKTFTETEDRYLIAIQNENIEGVLPLFIKQNDSFGTVINSLPFYGSNGGIISGNPEARQALIREYKNIIEKEKALSATIITSPFEKDNEFYEQNLTIDCKDSRTGQITYFPGTVDELMSIYHYKTRNAIRKGIKSGITCSWENGLDHVEFLFDTHRENMEKIGGLYKPKKFFDLIPRYFNYGKDYRIYVACFEGKPVAALLNFYFNKTVEYHTPVTIEAYRQQQPMSVLIYEAMTDAVKEGYSNWNWGGTWQTQDNVYDFKKRWGTKDEIYYYYVTLAGNTVKKIPKSKILQEYPFYFVLPFNLLENDT